MELKQLRNFFEVSAGSYAQIFVNETIAVKRPFDLITQDSIYFLFREGLYLKKGYGPEYHGPAVRRETRLKFVGYIMDRLEEPLSKYVPLGPRYSVFKDVAETLARMHNEGHIHCDIKPSNILISTEFKAFLTDFGLSSFASTSGPSPCESNAPLYTPVFRAPEHLLGSQRAVEASDVWALGMTMYVACLCPKYPGIEHSDSKKLLDILHVHVDPVDLKRSAHIRKLCLEKQLSTEFGSIICDCLIWVPDKRPRAVEIAKRINALQETLVVNQTKYLRLTKPNGIEINLLTLPTFSIGQSNFQKERIDLNARNFCKILNIETPIQVLEKSYSYCKMLDFYRPNIHNPGFSALFALYEIRESSLIPFVTAAKLIGISLLHFTELLEESMCILLCK